MDKDFVAAKEAYRKLKLARGLSTAVYLFGATGYGKTTLVRQYLDFHKYLYHSCANGAWPDDFIPAPKKNEMTYIVLDDLQFLRDTEKQQEVYTLAQRPDLWLVLIGRSALPHWLRPLTLMSKLVVIDEDDLSVDEEEITQIAGHRGMTLSSDQARLLAQACEGNVFAVLNSLPHIKQGLVPNQATIDQVQSQFSEYIEHDIIRQWDSDLQDFLMKVCVVDSFDLELAERLTGDDCSLAMIERTQQIGNFLIKEGELYTLRPVARESLCSRAGKILGSTRVAQLYQSAGNYYELHDNIIAALRMYEKIGDSDSIRSLLIRNARRHPGAGHYWELRKYYMALTEEETKVSPVLMAAVSCLYSIMMRQEESEYWYERLKEFSSRAQGGERREALSRLAYLDIALPHRGTAKIADIIKNIGPSLLRGNLEIPALSLTNNEPSTMNGGKDFSDWSKIDRLLAETLGKYIEKLLGKGIVHAALGESFYEKGDDNYETLSHLTAAQLEAESAGKPEIAFAAVGIQIRLTMLLGNSASAYTLLEAFRQKAVAQNWRNLLPTIAALGCRLALYTGDSQAVAAWMADAPDENLEFCTLERYRYLTKIRVYIQQGKNYEALLLLNRLAFFAKVNGRVLMPMEISLLSAIAKYRMGQPWQADLTEALRQAGSYHFVRLISEEGAAVLPLLTAMKKEIAANKAIPAKWFSVTLAETQQMAEQYPAYLLADRVSCADFSGQGLAVLKMQADGASVREISQALGITERTVKYHCTENYRKLNARNKADAIRKANALHLI